MPVLEKAPTTFKVDEHLDKVFSALGYENVNDTSVGAPGNVKAVRNLLATVSFSKWDQAYRGFLVKELIIHPTIIDSIMKKTAASDVIAASNFLAQYEAEPSDLDDIDYGTVIQASSGQASAASSPKRSARVGEIPAFKGKDDDWPIWKEKAIAQLKIDGLIKVIEDADYARIHPVSSTIVHGMLTKALIQTEGYGHFPCILDNKDDGHKAWKTLCEYYEHPLLIRNTLKDLSKRLATLNLTSTDEWDAFIQEFFWIRSRMTTCQERAGELNITAVSQFKVSCWKTTFLDKIKVPYLSVRVESCQRDTNMLVWEAVLSLKGYILDNEKLAPRKRKHGNKQSKGDIGHPEPQQDEQQKLNKPALANFVQKLKQTNDTDFIKRVKGLMEDNQERPKKRKRNNRHKQHSRRNQGSMVNHLPSEELDDDLDKFFNSLIE